ncbi:hypothetical protein KVR01_008262 [Diaporthe batatas]|uniref:uncharacterized protein n=1 Tax=Diaporthe batatas TaxID=748121 RepID=UPI001D039AD8|nr:uncharacterized protein KVR01_008262 [Diaporthe batatas]KAG8162497.1 hypothetical protein KVR01_008262 [Diaporthe batatas]
MEPWESETELGSDESGSDDETTPPSGAGAVVAQSSETMGSKKWKNEFFEKLGNIKTFGDFACSTRYPQHINPGLEVAGSLIPLPLVERDASTIKSKSEQAPFGRGDDTVVDESVRKTWQLDAGRFRCSNPAWAAFLDTVLRETVQKLGMPKSVRAVPWKLLLYEEGSFFRPHKDSEKSPGMIGTLVISLPSRHEGGEVHLSHCNKRHIFATSHFSEFELAALAWYSDVTHEIRPIASGYRLVMTYNLVQPSGPTPSPGLFVEQQNQLRGLLRQWRSAMPSKSKMIFRMEHKYSESSLSLQNMKGRDAQIIRCLKQACHETGFYLLLALMTMTETEPDAYEGDDDEETLQLDYVATLDGSCITRSVDVELSEILGPDPYKDRAADSEDEGDFTGNESAPSEFRYHDSAILIVPHKGLVDLVKTPQCSVENLIQMVCFSPAASPEGPAGRNEVVAFLASLLENFGPSINEEARLLNMILRACRLWSSQSLYNKAMRRAVMEAQRRTRYYLSHSSFMAPRTRSPTAEISEALSKFVNEFFSNPTGQDWDQCLGELVQGLDPASLNAALNAIQERLRPKELKESFEDWRSSVESNKFETKDSLTAVDLPFILDLIQSHSKDDEWIANRLLPKLSEQAEKPLLYALLHKLSAEKGFSALKNTSSVARRLFEATFPKLHVEIGDLEDKSQRSPQGSSNFGGASDRNNITSSVTGFTNLLENCFMNGVGTNGLRDRGMVLLRKSHESLSEAFGRLPPKGSKRDNATGLRPWGVPVVTERAPGEELLVDLDFIRAPDQVKGRFSYGKEIRRHLESVLPSIHYRCATDTTSGKGNCHTLVVTKIGKDTEYKEEMRVYEDKMRLYEKRLLSFRQPIVRRLLGNETYQSLIMVDSAPYDASTTSVPSKRSAGESQDQPASTRQRTEEVVDLTEE